MKKIALLTLLIIGNLTAYSQTSLREQDSLHCFNEIEAKTLLSYAEKGLILDSIIITYDKAIISLEEILQNKNDQLQISEQLINSQRNEIKKTHRENKLWMSLTCVSTLGLIFSLLF